MYGDLHEIPGGGRGENEGQPWNVEFGWRLRFDGLLRLKQREDSKIVWDIVAMECRWNAEFSLFKRFSWHKRHPRTLKRLARNPRSREYAGQTNIAGQDDSINICAIKSTHIRSWWTWLVSSSDIAESWQYRKSSLRLVVTATSTSCQPRSRTWILGVLTSLTLPGRNNSVARLVISVPSTTGTKTQVPKNPLFNTFTLTLLTAGASTWCRHSGASRAVEHLLQSASALVTKIS